MKIEPLLLSFVLGCPERIDVLRDARTNAIDADIEDASAPDAEPPDACQPECLRGVACGSSDGCGGVCLGTCPNDFEMVCHGGICNEHSWCPQAKCDLWQGVGCPQDLSCELVVDALGELEDIMCAEAGDVLEGDFCSDHSDCVDGHGCVVGRCRKYCCRPLGMAFVESSECGAERWCQLFFDRIGFCENLCDIRNESSCAPDQICVVSSEFVGINFCIESSPVASDVGGPCEFSNDCTHGLYCDGATCRRVCELGTSCLQGTCEQAFSGASFGICI